MSYYSDAVIRDGASAYFQLQETSGTIVKSSVAGVPDGTIYGNATLGVNGPFTGQKAIRFSGPITSQVGILVPTGAYQAYGTGPISLECWILTTGIQSDYSDIRFILDTIGNTSPGAALMTYGDGVNLDWIGRARATGGQLTTAERYYTWETASSGWHHLVTVFKRGTPDIVELYLDGVYISGQDSAVSGLNYTSTAGIGICTVALDATSNFIPATIAHCATYKVALTPAQIKNHYDLSKLSKQSSYYADKVIKDGAIAYWRLGETSGTIAVDLIGGNNGTISGGVTLNQDGALVDGDKAISLNGTDGKVRITTFTTPVEMTLEAWVRMTTNGERPAISIREAGGAGTFIFGVNSINQVYFFIDVSGGGTAGGPALNNNTWHHIVATSTATVVTIYADGIQVAQQSKNRVVVTRPLSIGFDSAANNWWLGSLDEVAIYNKALTPAQISSHYSLGKLQFPANSYPDRVIKDGAVAYWRLGETSGTTAADIISGSNGTINGEIILNQNGALPDDKAMLFNSTAIGSGQIIVPAGNHSAFELGSASIEIWIKISVVQNNGVIFTTNSPFSNLPGLSWMADNTNIYFIISTYDIFVHNGVPYTTDSIWHHYVGIVKRGSPDIYQVWVDGILGFESSDPTATGSNLTSSNDTRIGSMNTAQFFNGGIDEIAIYHTALTPVQILDHYNVGKIVTYIGNKSIPLGSVINLTQGEAYALPSRGTHLTSTAPVEISMDGTVFSSLTNADTVGARCSAKFIRSLSASCSLIIK